MLQGISSLRKSFTELKVSHVIYFELTGQKQNQFFTHKLYPFAAFLLSGFKEWATGLANLLLLVEGHFRHVCGLPLPLPVIQHKFKQLMLTIKKILQTNKGKWTCHMIHGF